MFKLVYPITPGSEVNLVFKFLHDSLQSLQLGSEYDNSSLHNILRWQCPSALHSEYELVIPFPHLHSSLQPLSHSKPLTLNAKDAGISILNFNGLSQLIEAKHLPGALRYEFLPLAHIKLSVQFVLVQLNCGLLSHLAGSHWGPLGMSLSNPLLSN